LLQRVRNNDYEGMYLHEIEERQKFNYPPFCRMIKITCKDISEPKASALSQALAERLIKHLGAARVLGPEASLIFKIRNYYLFEIYLKIEKEKINLQKVKQTILKEANDLLSSREYSNSRIAPDVDPV